jgi:hypothetical protein
MKTRALIVVVLAALMYLPLSAAVLARQNGEDKPVAGRTDLYCTGFISELPPRTEIRVIGGERENEKGSFAQGDIVYLNKGREGGVYAGAVYYIIRPLGEVKHPFTHKTLGTYARELGTLRVLEAHDRTATAEIIVSCDTIELGDSLRLFEAQVAPARGEGRPLPRYSEGSGGLRGQIVLARDFKEYVSANQIVFIDLGNRHGVRPGDQFTIYRKITRREGVATIPEDDIVQQRSDGFGSERYRGGNLSQSAPATPRDKVMRERPPLPRKVMGELVVLKVENTAAVALITRTTGEVNIGDFVERVN